MSIKIVVWNANGVCQHAQEIQAFLNDQNIDIMLISETHFTEKTFVKFHRYNLYQTQHPNGTARGGTAILIKSSLNHQEKQKYSYDHLQATSVELQTSQGLLTISAVYCPPRHTNKRENYSNYFDSLGSNFIAGGDYNAKHTHWGSRLTTTKGRELLAAMNSNNLNFLSTGEPTYWPTDISKTPDLLDFCVIKGIDKKRCSTTSCADLSSDHSPIIVTIHQSVIKKQAEPKLCSKKTNWNTFRAKIDQMIDLQIPLTTPWDIEEAVELMTKSIQTASWAATPDSHNTLESNANTNSTEVKNMITIKRRLRKKWQTTRLPSDKLKFNQSVRKLKTLLFKDKNNSVQHYLSNLSATQTTDYDLWKATKKLKQPQPTNTPIKKPDGNWTVNHQEKANLFADHLVNVFQPWTIPTSNEVQTEIKNVLDSPFQMDTLTRKFKRNEIRRIIRLEINPKKAPGFDLITGRILHELSTKCLKLLTMIYNAILRINYFPAQWKVAQIIMIQKPGKKSEEIASYRPISLLPTLSKLLEKLLLYRLKPILEAKKLIPNHQFGFRSEHSTIEQIHRIVNIINKNYEEKKFCSAAFLDISQAFDKVWHLGLLYKLKKALPYQYYQLLKSYLDKRTFFVKQNDKQSDLKKIESGVPQGSILGPLLYLIFTSDIPTTINTKIATFADDTAILSSHSDPALASAYLQENLNLIQNWLIKWKIKANEIKSTHITFTLKRNTCPPVSLNSQNLPQAEEVKYLGMHLDRRLTWKKHIWTKRLQLGIKFRKMYWLIGKNSKLSLENKILLYKSILRPIWTYGIQLWGSAAKSNLEILQRFQNKVLRIILDAPWFVPNSVIHNDLNISSIEEETTRFSNKYRDRLLNHPNELTHTLMDNIQHRRLKRNTPSDL